MTCKERENPLLLRAGNKTSPSPAVCRVQRSSSQGRSPSSFTCSKIHPIPPSRSQQLVSKPSMELSLPTAGETEARGRALAFRGQEGLKNPQCLSQPFRGELCPPVPGTTRGLRWGDSLGTHPPLKAALLRGASATPGPVTVPAGLQLAAPVGTARWRAAALGCRPLCCLPPVA